MIFIRFYARDVSIHHQEEDDGSAKSPYIYHSLAEMQEQRAARLRPME